MVTIGKYFTPSSLLFRRFRRGRPIVVVSGLPRSGTSMAMRMLEAGGVPVLSDGIRPADASNPNGYYEFERVKDLDKTSDAAWLADARGKAVKVVSFLLTHLPESYDYRVVFMQRDLREVLASQNAMLDARGQARDAGDRSQTFALYEHHLEQVRRFLAARPCFSTLTLEYAALVADPRGGAGRLAAFVGGGLDLEAMAGVIEPSLYRNRPSDFERSFKS